MVLMFLMSGRGILKVFKGHFKGFQNAVLSGYTDSDGSFGINVNANNTVDVTWSFDQSFEKPYLDYMCLVLGIGRVERKYPTVRVVGDDSQMSKGKPVLTSLALALCVTPRLRRKATTSLLVVACRAYVILCILGFLVLMMLGD